MKPQTKKALDKLLMQMGRELASMIFTRSQEQIDAKSISDTGMLRKSGDLVLTANGARIVYPVRYAKWVEFGTPPHRVSAEGMRKIAEWARRKLGAENPEAAAWAIRAKIAREGTEPRHFLRDGIDLGLQDFRKKYDGKTIRI